MPKELRLLPSFRFISYSFPDEGLGECFAVRICVPILATRFSFDYAFPLHRAMKG